MDSGGTGTDTGTDALLNADGRTVTVWSDLGCPWATLALHTLRERARERGRRVTIDHRAFPLELFNRMPTPKGILDAEIVTIAGHRPELGWRLWPGPDSHYPVTMLPPMEAVQAAKSPDVGGLIASDELDEALRRAFYVEGRCVSIHAVILDVAEQCAHVDTEQLAAALARGDGRAEVYRQWKVAEGPEVQGSPHLFAAGGFAVHNPGATYHWTAAPPSGFPRLDAYDPKWADDLLDLLDR
ncbi:DsbA family protein [Streptomyces sp. NPDC002888]|uniref:DsbA family oxidoreductase n=1 Tax=Streptomyces sp. NPDC002888 TaxID=3364668 RepID=UPI0036C9EEDA